MKRSVLVSIHLYLAAFFAPMVLMMAVTGGLKLFGYQGVIEASPVAVIENQTLNMKHDQMNNYVQDLLQSAGIDTNFETIRVYASELVTRPTSRNYYQLKQSDSGIAITLMQPDLNARLLELHKGHGPGLFKWLEKIFSIALILIMLSGLYLGLMSQALRQKTLLLGIAGSAVLVAAALL